MSREDAYQAVQRCAMPVWLEGADFLTNLRGDAAVTAHLSDDELAALFDLATIPNMSTPFSRAIRLSGPR